MNLTIETSRSQTDTAAKQAEKIFGPKLHEKTDALYLSRQDKKVIACTGLRYKADACMHLINDPDLYGYLSGMDGNILIDLANDMAIYQDSELKAIPSALKERIASIIATLYASAGSINEAGELEIDLKGYHVGSHYGVNLLLGDRSEYADCLQSTPKSVVDELGRGSFRGRKEKQVLATRYVLSPDENGEPANRQFYITENGRQIFYSLDVHTNVRSARCVHSQNHTVITYETQCGLKIIRTIFLLPQEKGIPSANEVQQIKIINLSDRPRDLRVIVTGMFGITDPGTLAGDIVYANVVVESELYLKDGRPIAMTAHHQPKECNSEKRYAMLINNGEPFDEYCSNLYDFIGSGTLDRPEMIARLNNAHSRRQASFFAMAKSFTLKDETVFNCFVGMDENEEDVRQQFNDDLEHLYERYSKDGEVEKTLAKMLKDNDDYYSFITLHSEDPLLDSYVSKNLPFQVLYQTYVSRSFAWTQKSYRETGFREIQDLFASMYYMHAADQDDLIERLIGSWAQNVFEMGYAYHNFTDRGKEPGMCSDDQLWLVQAVYRYVNLSGNAAFLKKELPVAGSGKTRPLHETLSAIVNYSGRISIGKHSLPLLDKADWNDCLRLDKDTLEGPEKEKLYLKQLQENNQEYGVPFANQQSESVMNACLLKIAADETAELLKMLGEDKAAQKAETIAGDTASSINAHAWKENWYARCLINDGRGYEYLGAQKDGLSLDPEIDGTFYLNSYSWALLADIADDEKIVKMLDVIDRYLKCPAGLKLVTPVDYDKLGIVTGSSFYFPGDRENGGVFKHAAMMATVASLKKAKTVKDEKLAERLRDLAFFMIGKTLPYKTLEDPFLLKGNPRFCTQYNNSITGENIGPILSGTASWLTLAFYEILGIDIRNGHLHIDPLLKEDLSYTLKIKDTTIEVKLRKDDRFRSTEQSLIRFDGKDVTSDIELPNDRKRHELEVLL